MPPAIAVHVSTPSPPPAPVPTPEPAAVSSPPVAAVSSPPPAASTPPPALSSEPTTISLDDDDDDDLDKIIAQANAAAAAKTSGSRDSSHSSLQIKSQRTDSLRQQQQFEVAALSKQFFDSGGAMPSSAARLALWHHAVGADKASDMASVTMYAVQTTPLDLPNQAALRKDVEDMCNAIFSSNVHTEAISASSLAQDTVDATRLLFLDNAEIVITYLCKKAGLGEYPPGLAFTFAPALAAFGERPDAA
ncbi:hypothetical protein PINS_up000333 [Pythium insidiosum]|nr:hypothetical protein PINS_up000333 [Pythium insidiosum]